MPDEMRSVRFTSATRQSRLLGRSTSPCSLSVTEAATASADLLNGATLDPVHRKRPALCSGRRAHPWTGPDEVKGDWTARSRHLRRARTRFTATLIDPRHTYVQAPLKERRAGAPQEYLAPHHKSRSMTPFLLLALHSSVHQPAMSAAIAYQPRLPSPPMSHSYAATTDTLDEDYGEHPKRACCSSRQGRRAFRWKS